MNKIQGLLLKELTDFLQTSNVSLSEVFVVPVQEDVQQFRVVLRISSEVNTQDFTVRVNKWAESSVRVFKTLPGVVLYIKEHFLIDQIKVLTSASNEFNQRFQ